MNSHSDVARRRRFSAGTEVVIGLAGRAALGHASARVHDHVPLAVLGVPEEILAAAPCPQRYRCHLRRLRATQMAAISWSLTNHEVLGVVHELAAVVVVDGPDAIVAVDPWPAVANLRQRVAGASMPISLTEVLLDEVPALNHGAG